VSLASIQRQRRRENSNLPNLSEDWKHLKSVGEKNAFLKDIVNAKGYENLNDIAAICGVTMPILSKNP